MRLKNVQSRFRSWKHYAEALKLFAPSFGWYRLRQERGLEDYPFLPDSDFGRFCDKGDQDIVSPTSVREVSDLLRRSHTQGFPVNICGRHHSMNGQTLARTGGKRLAMDFPFNYLRGADEGRAMGRGTCLFGLVFFGGLSKRATFFSGFYHSPEHRHRRNPIGKRGRPALRKLWPPDRSGFGL